MSKKIGMVLHTPFAVELRVRKEARTLLNAGYHITLLAAPESGAPETDTWEGMRIVRARLASARSFSYRALYAWNLATFVHPTWLREIRRFVLEAGLDALHVHDLLLAHTALKAVDGRIPVVLDLHENYPAAMREWNIARHGVEGLVFRFFGSYGRWLSHERRIVRRADQVIAVVDEMKERLVMGHGIAPERVCVVGNTESAEFAGSAAADTPGATPPTLLYIGGLGPHRGLDTAIRAMPEIGKRVPGTILHIVGKGPHSHVRELHRLVWELDVGRQVTFTDWVPASAVAGHIRQATIGLVPHNSNEQTEHTVPHKLFQYMALACPVLVSSCRPLARIVTETGAGMVFRAGDARDFAARAVQMLSDEASLDKMGQRGRGAALCGGWSWEKRDAPALLNCYTNVFRSQCAFENIAADAARK